MRPARRRSASSCGARIERLQRDRDWLQRYVAARERVRTGETNVVFPYGTWKARIYYGAACEPPPDRNPARLSAESTRPRLSQPRGLQCAAATSRGGRVCRLTLHRARDSAGPALSLTQLRSSGRSLLLNQKNPWSGLPRARELTTDGQFRVPRVGAAMLRRAKAMTDFEARSWPFRTLPTSQHAIYEGEYS